MDRSPVEVDGVDLFSDDGGPRADELETSVVAAFESVRVQRSV
jgi:hypothetical protein